GIRKAALTLVLDHLAGARHGVEQRLDLVFRRLPGDEGEDHADRLVGGRGIEIGGGRDLVDEVLHGCPSPVGEAASVPARRHEHKAAECDKRRRPRRDLERTRWLPQSMPCSTASTATSTRRWR